MSLQKTYENFLPCRVLNGVFTYYETKMKDEASEEHQSWFYNMIAFLSERIYDGDYHP